MNKKQIRLELKKKQAILEKTSNQLKLEFVGLDDVIDNVINSITSWYCFNDIMKRPLVINLWGMTGIGKTSLVRRLVELLEFSERYFHFDTNSYGNGSATFEDIYNVCRERPFILTLDEFQLARTIDEDRKEQNNTSLKHIWDILDNGKYSITDFNERLVWLHFFIERLQRTLLSGFTVKNGKVIGDYIEFCKLKTCNAIEGVRYNYVGVDNFDFHTYKKNNKKNPTRHKETIRNDNKEYIEEYLEERLFICESEFHEIFHLISNISITKKELQDKFLTMDGFETIKYLQEIYNQSLKPKIVDCSKALIFVIGNLDEVYTMSKNFNPDISADEFNELSLKITLPDVKNALLMRFRSEQISRLGNNHIIYPSFREKDFYKIIEIELNKIKDEIKKLYNITINFNEYISKLIYKEGVFPTQGCRPVFSTIYELVQARLGKIFVKLFSQTEIKIDTINFEVLEEDWKKLSKEVKITISAYSKGKTKKPLEVFQEVVPLKLVKLIESTRDDRQAITAVHEAGHCICEIVLNKTVPTQVVSVTSDSHSQGFTYTRDDYEYMSKNMVKNHIAMMFGGIVAEEMIFGKENITNGSINDITHATIYAQDFITKYGFGEYPISLSYDEVPTMNDSFVERGEHIALLKECKEIAMKTLTSQNELLIELARYLADNSSINKDKIIEFVKKYSKDIDIEMLEKNKKQIFYRKQLLEKNK